MKVDALESLERQKDKLGELQKELSPSRPTTYFQAKTRTTEW
jgi:hypothetical protein